MSIAVGILLFIVAACFLALMVRVANDIGDYLVLVPLACANAAGGVMNIASSSDAWQIGVGVWLCVLAMAAMVGTVLTVGNRISQGRHRGAPGWAIGLALGATALFTTFGVLQLTLVA